MIFSIWQRKTTKQKEKKFQEKKRRGREWRNLSLGTIKERHKKRKMNLINWNRVSYPIATVHDDSSCSSRGVKRKHSLDGHIHGWHIESLKHDGCHFLSIHLREDNFLSFFFCFLLALSFFLLSVIAKSIHQIHQSFRTNNCSLSFFFSLSLWHLGIHWSLSEEHRMVLRSNTQLIKKSMMPNLLHIIPISDNSVFDRVLDSQNSSFALGVITNVMLLFCCAL